MAGIICRGCFALPLIFSLERSKVKGIRYCTVMDSKSMTGQDRAVPKMGNGGEGGRSSLIKRAEHSTRRKLILITEGT
jgi:hypothetical protein